MPVYQEWKQQAWQIGRQRGLTLRVSAPGAKHYNNHYFANQRQSFVNLSVTGTSCALECAHCRGRLLNTMVPVTQPEILRREIDRLAAAGCQGILVSGGADRQGRVPLLPFADALGYARDRGLRVLVHSGLIDRKTALALARAGVNQVLMDVIGDADTIRQVYHLDRLPEDYLASMLICREAGLDIAPHLVIGLHFGQLKGEDRALEMIKEAQPQVVVLVVLAPLTDTLMAEVEPPTVEEVASLLARARLNHPDIPVNLGCARPVGAYKRALEKTAVDCGLDTIAFADEATIDYAASRGLNIEFTQDCCSLAGLPL